MRWLTMRRWWQPDIARAVLAGAAATITALWVSICAAAPEFLWQGMRLAAGHLSRADVLGALLIGIVLAFFVEPLMERGRHLLTRSGHRQHAVQRTYDGLFTAGLSLAFAFASVCLHEAMTAFVSDRGHAAEDAGLVAGVILTVSWALVPFAVTLAWLGAEVRGIAVALGGIAAASPFVAGWLFEWPLDSVIATALPCLAILALGYRALAWHRLARYVAGVAVVWLLLALLFDAALPRLGLERFLLYDAANFWIDVRFYLGWALGLVLAPLPRQPGGTLATSRTPPSAPLP